MDFHWITELNWREGAHVVVGSTLKMAMGEVDGEFSSLMCPEYDAAFADLTIKELSSHLQKSGFTLNHCDILEDFAIRKKFWDFLCNLNSVHSPVLIQSGRSTPLSNVSTLSPSNSSVSLDLEEDSPLSQSLAGPSMPVLKQTKPREFPEPPKKKVKHLAQDFKLPISSKVNEFVQQNRSLDESTRRQLIRETVTCVQAYVGEHVSSNHFEEAAKQLCEKVPLLRDVKPPLWPDEIEFSYWASAKHLLLKRYSNVKSSSKKGKRPEPAISDETDQSTEDVSKHNKELQKELRNRVVNWKAVEQLQSLTFGERREVISSIKGVHAVSNMLEQFPFFEEEKVLLWELELVVSKLMNVRVPYEVFIARWKRLAICFVDMTENRSDDSTALDALRKIHEPFSPMGPLLLTLSDGQKMESFLKNVPSKSPYLVYTGADKSTGSEEQIFLIIDEDVLLECTQVSKDHCLFTSSLLTCMAI
ncbi:uncharacterized protein [Acropora muricata]|uniref:uncharacterized protein isoform X2 n=1 Tax=Acropora muricata TaxID=159855 RepID=UPI0034E57A2C